MSKPRLTRRPAAGGYDRGDETRQRIIEAAIAAFAEQGYDGTSTRTLVERSASNAAAIQYYFGGKMGLYCACAEHIVALALSAAENANSTLENIQPDESREQLLDRMCDYFERQAAFLNASHRPDSWVMFLAREQLQPTASAAFDILFKGLIGPQTQKAANVVGRIIGKPGDAPETLLRTFLMSIQLLALRVSNKSMLSILGWPSLTGKHFDMWKAVMKAHLRAMLMAEVVDD